MMRILLAVPNLATADRGVLDGLPSNPPLDVHVDSDHARTVVTYGADPAEVLDSCDRLVRHVVTRIDLADDVGVHPRFGVVDVLPFVPYGCSEREAERAAAEITSRIAHGPAVPVYTYDRAHPGGRTLPELRRWLRTADVPRHPTAGVICLGIRDPLIAFNVNLRGTIDAARRAVRELRRTPGIRALAFELRSRGLVQLSMNLHELGTVGPADAFARATALATKERLELVDSEVVGLVPHAFLEEFEGMLMRGPVRSIEQALGMTSGEPG